MTISKSIIENVPHDRRIKLRRNRNSEMERVKEKHWFNAMGNVKVNNVNKIKLLQKVERKTTTTTNYRSFTVIFIHGHFKITRFIHYLCHAKVIRMHASLNSNVHVSDVCTTLKEYCIRIFIAFIMIRF